MSIQTSLALPVQGANSKPQKQPKSKLTMMQEASSWVSKGATGAISGACGYQASYLIEAWSTKLIVDFATCHFGLIGGVVYGPLLAKVSGPLVGIAAVNAGALVATGTAIAIPYAASTFFTLGSVILKNMKNPAYLFTADKLKIDVGR